MAGNVVFMIGPEFCGHSALHHLSSGIYDERPLSEVFCKDAWYGASYQEIRRRRLLGCLSEIQDRARNTFPLKPFRQIAELQNQFKVSVITQDVDDLLERAGVSDVLHIYGSFSSEQEKSTENLLDISRKPSVLLWDEEIEPQIMSSVLNLVHNADQVVIAGWDNSMPMAVRIAKSASQKAEVYFLGKDKSIVPDDYYRAYFFLEVHKWDKALDIIRSWLFT